jgi:hypothetical protein
MSRCNMWTLEILGLEQTLFQNKQVEIGEIFGHNGLRSYCLQVQPVYMLKFSLLQINKLGYYL